MIMNSVTSIYFSPTGTTRKIIDSIVKGLAATEVNTIDLTLPGERNGFTDASVNDLALIGLPVYEDGIPNVIYDNLIGMKGINTPAVIVVVYGNVGEGKALQQIANIVNNAGFKVIAAASFIGEHSFSTEKAPLAKGRPDNVDLNKAEEFGRLIAKKLEEADDLDDVCLKIPKPKVSLMGLLLPKNSAKLFTKSPAVNLSICSHCGECSKSCPVAAIDPESLSINEELCIRCSSCVKNCPLGARRIEYKKKILITAMFRFKNRIRKEPKTYF